MSETANIINNMLRDMTTGGVLTADFTNGGKTRSATLTSNRLDAANGRRTFIERHDVAGKREARALAERLGAKCWNF